MRPSFLAPKFHRLAVLQALILIAAGLFVYAPVFHGGWVWDDQVEITTNAAIQSPDGLVKIWKGGSGADYLPVKSTLQWLAFKVFGMNAPYWHWLNIGLHLWNALLVWKLLARLGVRSAWLGGLIFAIHPVLVESVAWISELKNTLSLAFLLPSMLAYIAFAEGHRRSDFHLALGFYLLAFLSKSSVVMFPCVILLYRWWKFGGLTWRDLIGSSPFFFISLIGGLVTIHFQFTKAIGDMPLAVGGLASRTATAGLAIVFYLSKCLLPLGLLPSYPRWNVDPPSLWQFSAWPVIFLVLWWLWTKRTTWGRHVLLGIGFFLLNLLPILGFITMSYMQMSWVADHFVYLPFLGIIGLLVVGADALSDHLPQYRKSLAALGIIALGFLMLTGHTYARVFVNETVLWTYTLRNNPHAWQAHLRLGKIMVDHGDNDGAFAHNAEAVRLRPDLAVTHNNYAVTLQIKGHHAAAISELQEAIRLDPKDKGYKVNLADFFILQEQYRKGGVIYAQLLATDPHNPSHLTKYGSALYSQGRNEEAIACLQKALAITPHNKEALNILQAAQAKKAQPGDSPPKK